MVTARAELRSWTGSVKRRECLGDIRKPTPNSHGCLGAFPSHAVSEWQGFGKMIPSWLDAGSTQRITPEKSGKPKPRFLFTNVARRAGISPVIAVRTLTPFFRRGVVDAASYRRSGGEGRTILRREHGNITTPVHRQAVDLSARRSGSRKPPRIEEGEALVGMRRMRIGRRSPTTGSPYKHALLKNAASALATGGCSG